MKKIILGGIALTLSFCLFACGNTQSTTALTKLANQLDATTNTISSIQTINPSDINITPAMIDSIAAKDIPSSIAHASKRTIDCLSNEQHYRTEILNRSSTLKNCLSKDLKLSKTQTTAVKELTDNLSKYTNSISYTKDELKDSVQLVSNMKKNISKNSEKINAKLNRIACNSNSRCAFYENIINTLSQLENCICYDCNTEINDENTTTETTKRIKNIDTYQSNSSDCPNCDKTETTLNNTEISPNNVYNRYNRFANTRNTDTYGPTMRNIDTFGGYNNGYGYGYNGYNGYYGYNGLPPINGIYHYGNPNIMPRLYNSNNFNRMTTPVIESDSTYVNSDNPSEKQNLEKEENVNNQIMTLEEPIVKSETKNNSAETAQHKESDLPITAHDENTQSVVSVLTFDVNTKIANLMKK